MSKWDWHVWNCLNIFEYQNLSKFQIPYLLLLGSQKSIFLQNRPKNCELLWTFMDFFGLLCTLSLYIHIIQYTKWIKHTDLIVEVELTCLKLFKYMGVSKFVQISNSLPVIIRSTKVDFLQNRPQDCGLLWTFMDFFGLIWTSMLNLTNERILLWKWI